MNLNRIPKNFIIVKGSGESDLARHPGSYHFALKDANNIHKYNIINYSSVLHKDCDLLSLDEVDMPEHGSELMCIMANAEGVQGDTINAGIIYAWLYSDEDFEHKVGGFVCELTNNGTSEQLEERLYSVINDGYDNTFKLEGLYIGEPNVVIESLRVEKRFGNALVSMCFIDFI